MNLINTPVSRLLQFVPQVNWLSLGEGKENHGLHQVSLTVLQGGKRGGVCAYWGVPVSYKILFLPYNPCSSLNVLVTTASELHTCRNIGQGCTTPFGWSLGMGISWLSTPSQGRMWAKAMWVRGGFGREEKGLWCVCINLSLTLFWSTLKVSCCLELTWLLTWFSL